MSKLVRMVELKAVADVQFGEGDLRREVVALGFIRTSVEAIVRASSDADALGVMLSSARWFELENIVGVDSGSGSLSGGADALDAGSAFEVGVEELQDTLDVALGLGMGQWTRILWHSHYRSASPSDYDLENFPEWLCDLGVIYYGVGGGMASSVLYSSGGELKGAHSVSAGEPQMAEGWPFTPTEEAPTKEHLESHATTVR